MKRKCVLVVDDEKELLMLIQDILEEDELEVFTAQNGKEGLDICRKVRPDVVLIDYAMPGLTGLEVIHQVKTDPHLKGIPCVLMSGLIDLVFFKEQLSKGNEKASVKSRDPRQMAHRTPPGLRDKDISAYLSKPFSRAQLLEVLGPLWGTGTSKKPKKERSA